MHYQSLKRGLGLLAIAAGLVSLPVMAKERWYQVELLVFGHESGDRAEHWAALPALAYPEAARFLVYPALVAARHKEFGGESRVDEFGRQLITLADPGADIPVQAPPSAPSRVETGVSGTDMTEETGPEAEPPPLLPTPYIALPHLQRELHGKSAYMNRTGRFQTLFHETWLQPVGPETDALPLVLDDSGALQDWPRLQGSVKLYLSRYLHIETNLWLNTPGDYLPGEWQMPPPPLGPPSLIVEAPEPPLDPEPYFVSRVPEPLEPNDVADPNEIALEDTGPIYPWRHAILMQQSRRMRSNELHYLDHPLLGVVVKLTPLDEEQLAALAAAEAVADEAN
jgi:hypothetical protein